VISPLKTKRGPASIKLFKRVLRDCNLPLAAIGFYAKMKCYAGPLGVIPSGDTMADGMKINRKTAWKYIGLLEKEGWVRRVHRINPETKKRTSNAYILKDEERARTLLETTPSHVPKNGTQPLCPKKRDSIAIE